MAKYFDKKILPSILEASKEIVKIRNSIAQLHGIDLLDTDAISSLFIYEIVSKYDLDYNINFSRNGEDAKSNGILIEQKATRILGPLTKTGKPRRGYGEDAAFQFHAMGDLDYPRYIFVARNRDDLSIDRMYDIGDKSNRKKVLDCLMQERQAWLARCNGDEKKMKRDIIVLSEKFILENINFNSRNNTNNCTVFKD